MLNIGDEARWHTITVGKLREILSDPYLNDDDVLIPNAVKNLAVERAGEYVAYIDLGADEAVVLPHEGS